MTDKRDGSIGNPFEVQRALKTRLSRRELMKYAGAAGGAVSLSAFLAACGGSDDGGGSGTTSGSGGANPFDAPLANEVNFANWPLYIDKAKGSFKSPGTSLYKYEEKTGAKVNYQEVIQDNASFFGKIQPQLSADQDTGWDIIVITNGRELTAMIANEWLIPLDTTKRPNWDANALPYAKNPYFDPGAKHTMCWQSGVTGIVTNKDLTGGEVLTSWNDLKDPTYQGQIGMLKAEMADAAMVAQGIDPETSTPEDWLKAAEWLQEQRDAGVVRNYYEQGYVDQVTAGNLAASMAWSGDILYYKYWEGYDNLEFVVPDEGGLLWMDNMLVPANAQHPSDAMAIMDYYYQPEIATLVTEWVLYMSPVAGVQELILADSEAAMEKGWTGYAKKLEVTANDPMLFPDDAALEATYNFRDLKTDEEREEWDSIFEPIMQ